MGRHRKPTELKVINGTHRKDRELTNAAQFDRMTSLEPPVEIRHDERAVAKWNDVVPQLAAAGVLKVTDKDILLLFCMAYSRYWAAQEELDRHGLMIVNPSTGMLARNPAQMIAKDAYAQMTSTGARLGLDPASRQGIAGKDKSGSQSRWAEFD